MLLDADNCGATYATADITAAGWASHSNFSVVSGGGRAGANCLACQVNGFVGRNLRRVVTPLGSTRHLFHGFAYRSSLSATYDLVSVHDVNGVQHITLSTTGGTGVITVSRGSNSGTALGTCAVALSAGVTVFIEIEVFIDDAAGIVRVWIDDVLAFDFTGDTRNAGLASWGVLTYLNNGVNHSGCDVRYSDWYVCDDAGLPPWNTRLSDISVIPHWPTAAGNSAQWTRGGTDSGQNWSQMDEGTPNGDTDFVTAVVAGKQDLYKFQALKQPGHLIVAVQSVMHARKVDAGTAYVGCSFRHGPVDYPPASGEPLGLDYRYVRQMFTTNPGTGSGWTEAAFNAIEAGPYKNS